MWEDETLAAAWCCSVYEVTMVSVTLDIPGLIFPSYLRPQEMASWDGEFLFNYLLSSSDLFLSFKAPLITLLCTLKFFNPHDTCLVVF